MSTALKRLGISLLLFISFFISTSPIYAQTTSPPCDPQTHPEGCPVSTGNYKAPQNSDYTFDNLAHSISCMGVGTDLATGTANNPCLGYNNTGNLQVYKYLPNGGALGGIGNVMVALYTNPPTSTTEYLANLGGNLGIISPAYAQVQGAGGGVIQPVLKAWSIVRNIAYFAFIIVFMVVGLMIMFRSKINPQTVISVQAALPGLVVGLILVTFSYFISALLIDTSFLGMHVAASLFSGVNNILSPDQQQRLATNGNILDLFGSVIINGSTWSNIADPIKNSFTHFFPFDLFHQPTNFDPTHPIASTAQKVKGSLINSIGELIGWGLGIIGMLVVIITLIIQMFKLLWALIQAYITILITTVISPFIILAASIPGRGTVLSGWWKTILANALIFPAVFGVFLFAGMFLGNTNDQTFQNATTLPLFNGLPTNLFRTILAYGIILTAPGIPKWVKSTLKVEDNPLGQVAQAGFFAGSGAVGEGFKRATAPYQAVKQQIRDDKTKTRAGILRDLPPGRFGLPQLGGGAATLGGRVRTGFSNVGRIIRPSREDTNRYVPRPGTTPPTPTANPQNNQGGQGGQNGPDFGGGAIG